MDPLTIAMLVSGGTALLGTGANVYGAHKSDQQASADRAYSRERDAIGDKRQAVQDRIANEMRRKQELQAMLQRADQQRQQLAGMYHPTMAGA